MPKQAEAASAKIIQLLAADPVRGGDNTIEVVDGRVTIAAWALQDDGTIVALVRSGTNLVLAEEVSPREPAPEPVGLTETPTEPAEEEAAEVPVEPPPAEEG